MLILALVACVEQGPDPITLPPDDLPPTAKVEVWRAMATDAAEARAPSDGQGTATLVEGPEGPVVAGMPGRWHLRFTVGPLGVAEGGLVAFQSPPFWGWSPAQTHREDAPGFTTVETAAEGVTLDVTTAAEGLVVAKVRGRALRAGETVDFVYGAGPLGAVADRFAERGQGFWFAVDGDGDGFRAVLPEPVPVDVVAGPPVGLLVTGPTTARPGETVRVTVAALDARANSGTGAGLDVALDAPGLELPDRVVLDDQGRAVLVGRAPVPGVFTVHAATADGLAGTSNPLLVHPDAQPILWADLQVHTGLSDGTGALDEVHAYARDVANLDAVAVTDHDHWGMRFLDREPALWAEVVAAADRWYAPGAFVTFAAYEWTSWLYGHRHVLYVGEPGPVFGSLDMATRHPRGLWAALADHDALVVPHHPAGGPVAVDWSIPPDPRLEPVVEICSVHGSSEADDAPGRIYGYVREGSVRAALARGHRLGFLCGTDGHDGHPGLAHLVAGQGGLAAILTADRTREGVAAAIRARRVYGTNGPRILLRVITDGHEMGSEVPARDGPVPVEVRVVGTAPVARIDLIHDGEVAARLEGGDGAVAHGVLHLPRAPVGTWAYVRVVQADGGAAWSSPVWFVEAAP